MWHREPLIELNENCQHRITFSEIETIMAEVKRVRALRKN